jgi:hypothetical protein
MTQLAISDKLASTLEEQAALRECSTEDLLQAILVRLALDDALADEMATPALGERIAADLRSFDEGRAVTSEQVDTRFAALYQTLREK